MSTEEVSVSIRGVSSKLGKIHVKRKHVLVEKEYDLKRGGRTPT